MINTVLGLQAARDVLTLVRDRLNAGGAWQLFAGTPADTEASATPLATVPIEPNTAALHATLARLQLAPVVGYASASGVPAWARAVDSAGRTVLQTSAGAPGSGAGVIVSDGSTSAAVTLFVGGELTVSATVEF